MSERKIAINVDHVYKSFKLPHESVSSVKSAFVNPFKSKENSKTEEQHALRDITFKVEEGEFFGIVGRNGSGKSTLLKIIAGIYQPTTGSVRVEGRLVPFIELGVGFNPELSGRENVYLNGALMGFSTKEVDAKFDAIVEFAELERFMDQKLKNYSSGMQVRLAFSVATILADSDVLLIDEVLAVGDAAFQRKCFNFFKSLKKNKKSVIFVSHDMAAVKEFCDRALLIDDSKVIEIGNTDRIAQLYAELFMDENSRSDSVQVEDKRWGSGAATIEDCKVKLKSDDIVVKHSVHTHQSIDKVTCGVHISSNDGEELMAVNNLLLNQASILGSNDGDVYNISWNIQNIFSDGEYTVTLTAIDETGAVLDWRVDVGEFSVKRPIRSATHILPPVTFNINKD